MEEIKNYILNEINISLDKFNEDNNFPCIFCSFESNKIYDCLIHLLVEHNFLFENINKIPLINLYLNFWRTHLPPIIEIKKFNLFFQSINILNEEDIKIKKDLHFLRLEKIMNFHENERLNIQENISCLFCNKLFKGTWHEYLQWLFDEHQFNPGRPSNLIFIPQLIEFLQNQLNNDICIYCNLKLPNQRKLRSHMRKKKHMRISSDSFFDRFYMINYLELEGNEYILYNFFNSKIFYIIIISS